MWFKLNGDARLGHCDSANCGGQPTWRLEAGGIGSNYCSGCKERIDDPPVTDHERARDAALASIGWFG
jgi:hypothetical protein